MAQTKKKAGKKKVLKKKTAAKKPSGSSRKTVKATAVKKVKKKAPAKKSAPPSKASKKSAKKVATVKQKPSKPAKTIKKASVSAKTKTVKKASMATKTSAVTKKKKLVAPPKLDPAVIKIRDTLVSNRGELLKLIRSSQAVERDVGEITFSNEIDLASSLEGREMLFQLTSRDRNELRLIEDALFNIEKGTYGICQSCAKRISMKRLQILPLTTLCIECQESLERA